MIKYCANPDCRKRIEREEFGDYCSNECKLKDMGLQEQKWATISVKVGIREILQEIQIKIYAKTGDRIGYSEIIKKLIDNGNLNELFGI